MAYVGRSGCSFADLVSVSPPFTVVHQRLTVVVATNYWRWKELLRGSLGSDRWISLKNHPTATETWLTCVELSVCGRGRRREKQEELLASGVWALYCTTATSHHGAYFSFGACLAMCLPKVPCLPLRKLEGRHLSQQSGGSAYNSCFYSACAYLYSSDRQHQIQKCHDENAAEYLEYT